MTAWLFSRDGVAKSPCKCGSLPGIYRSIGVIQEIANLITSINSMDLSKENLPKINYEKNLMIDLIEDDRNYINHISLASLVKQRGGQHSIRNMDTLV